MFCSMQQQYIVAYLLIFAGYELDRFDGMVARWRDECSEWGKELDSFSDQVRVPPHHRRWRCPEPAA